MGLGGGTRMRTGYAAVPGRWPRRLAVPDGRATVRAVSRCVGVAPTVKGVEVMAPFERR